MKALKSVPIRVAVMICASSITCGCQLLKQVERNTAAIDENRNAIEKTTKSIQSNADAVNQSTSEIGINSGAVRTASEAILANARIVNESTILLKEIQLATVKNKQAIRENQAAIETNTSAIIANEHEVQQSSDVIGKTLRQLDAILNRLAFHKTVIIISSLALILFIVAPYIALWIILARLNSFTKSLRQNSNLR